MSASLRYLEEAKIEELAHEYESKGFTIAKDYHDAGATYDLVASRGQAKIAIEVKARAALSSHTEEIKRLRTIAQDRGYSFQLFIVNPPLERQIQVDQLETLLLQYFIDHMPEELDELSSHTSIDAVSEVDIRAITVTQAGFDVTGVATIEVALEYGGGEERDGVSWEMAFPLDFALSINHQFEITEVEELVIDTSSFDE